MNWRKDLYASYVNLEHRKDRNDHMRDQFKKTGLEFELRIVRQPGLLPKDIPHDPRHNVMRNRTPGAIGCHLSQVEIMRKAYNERLSAFVMEDDLVFCSDFIERLAYIENSVNNFFHDFDIIWLGGTFHSPAFWHPIGNSKMRPNCSSNLGRDCETTDDPRMIRTFGAFCTYAYIINFNSIPKVISLLDTHLHESIGIDWEMIKIQPQLKTYAFVPGCIKQMDNMSDIGTGMTMFSGFSKLNGTIENSAYWWQDKMNDFNPQAFEWK